MIIMNLVTPKPAAKHNLPSSGRNWHYFSSNFKKFKKPIMRSSGTFKFPRIEIKRIFKTKKRTFPKRLEHQAKVVKHFCPIYAFE